MKEGSAESFSLALPSTAFFSSKLQPTKLHPSGSWVLLRASVSDWSNSLSASTFNKGGKTQ